MEKEKTICLGSLTLKDIKEIHKKYNYHCSECPLVSFMTNCAAISRLNLEELCELPSEI